MARGAEQPSIAPVWCRNFLPPPPPPPPQPNNNNTLIGQPPIPLPALPIPDYQLEPATIDISLDKIKELKQEFHKWSGRNCSTFEMVVAMLWRQRTLAINLKDETAPVKLLFFANCRHLLEPPLPEGFYGNCFFPVTVTASSGMLTEEEEETGGGGGETVFRLVRLIQEAKAGMAIEFGKWANKETCSMSDPFGPTLEYSTLLVSEWGRLGFMEVDYGWGRPVHIVPIQGSSFIPAAIVCSQPSPKTGVRLMTWCVHKPHLQSLLHHMNHHTSMHHHQY